MQQTKNNSTGPRFQKIKRIGEGTYGTVTKVYDNKLKIFIAVKKIKFYDQDETIPIHALREITSLKQMNHPNILKLYHVTYQPEKRKLYMNCQYIEETLYQNICKNKTLSIYSIKTYSWQILKAMKYLEGKGYMHRDLKPQNIMLGKNYDIKLIDFGQIKKISIGKLQKLKNTLQISTLWYKAPQLLLGYEYYNNKIDIWALGCIIVQMITGNPLFQGKSQIEQVFKIFQAFGTPKIQENQIIKNWPYFNSTLPKFQEKQIFLLNLDEDGNNLIRKMLTINPNNRISVDQALKHPFFHGLQ